MKSSFELAMERLNKSSPTVKLTESQKKQLAELDTKYAALIAAREIALNGEIAKATDVEKEESLREQLLTDRKKLQAELEEKKDRIRAGK